MKPIVKKCRLLLLSLALAGLCSCDLLHAPDAPLITVPSTCRDLIGMSVDDAIIMLEDAGWVSAGNTGYDTYIHAEYRYLKAIDGEDVYLYISSYRSNIIDEAVAVFETGFGSDFQSFLYQWDEDALKAMDGWFGYDAYISIDDEGTNYYDGTYLQSDFPTRADFANRMQSLSIDKRWYLEETFATRLSSAITLMMQIKAENNGLDKYVLCRTYYKDANDWVE